MERYIQAFLKNYLHPLPSKPQHAPQKHFEITYGAKQHLITDNNPPPALDIDIILRVQGIVVALLYYAQAVDNKLIITLSKIVTQQARAAEATTTAINQLPDYVAT